MRAITVIFCGLTMCAPTYAVSGTDFPAASERAFREMCSAHSEAGVRDCLTKKARESEAALQRAEQQIGAVLSRWDEDPKYVDSAKTTFAVSEKAFSRYREAQCAFAKSLGGGAIGNALEMRRLACVAELNSRRAEQLRNAASELPVK